MSKGSAPRPKSVDIKTFDNNWDAIFGKKNKTEEVKEKKEKKEKKNASKNK
jgi:hypothetical protein